MANRRTFAALAAISAIAAANFVSACVRSDDQDTFSTPTPPPAPTPRPKTHCQVVWASPNPTTPTDNDVLVLDAPKDQWVNGTATIGTAGSPTFQYYYLEDYNFGGNHQPDLTQAIAFTVGSATADTFTISGITLNGVQPGEPISVSDPTMHLLFGLDTAGMPVPGVVIGSAGKSSFDGNWSDYAGTSVDLSGSGMAKVGFGTGLVTLGVSGDNAGTYAACYDIPQ